VSSIDIYAVLAKLKASWSHILPAADHVIEDIARHLREAEKSGYLGTLYRTDYVVEGSGAFPVDMLRYTSSWPKDEGDARAIEDSIEDSFDGGGRRTITLTMKHRDPAPNLAGDRWASKFRWRVVRVVDTVPI
jgi:hypothetical protein